MFRPTPPGVKTILPGVVDRGEMGTEADEVRSKAMDPTTATSGLGWSEAAVFTPLELPAFDWRKRGVEAGWKDVDDPFPNRSLCSLFNSMATCAPTLALFSINLISRDRRQ